jgi:hypothetical protein
MRRALAAFLILSLLGGQVGMFGALMGRHQARQEMDSRIAGASESPGSMADVQHLTIPRSELQSTSSTFVWIEDHEFRYQGNLYDIVSEEWRGSVWHVWVYHDREEEHYTDLLAETLSTSLIEGESAPVQQRPVGSRPLALVPSALVSLPPPRSRTQSFPGVSFTEHEAPYLEVPHPPPWG